jgi:hypothetical protein
MHSTRKSKTERRTEKRDVKRSKPHHMSTPNYRKLNKTPRSERQEKIASVIQFGQPAKDENPSPSKRNANQTRFPSKTKEMHGDAPVVKLKPLSMEQRGSTNPLPKSKTTVSTPMQRPFRNLFDHPLTARELQTVPTQGWKSKNHSKSSRNALGTVKADFKSPC